MPQADGPRCASRVLRVNAGPQLRQTLAGPKRMKRLVAMILMSALASFQAACGYFAAGEWEDDPGNWGRAWGYAKPDDVTMVHSWYWRSPHWTREEAYFFQFRWHQELFDELVARNGMVRSKFGSGDPIKDASYCRDKPSWFAPKSGSSYDLWHCPSTTGTPAWVPPSCLLFRDNETNELFVYACQL